MSYLNILNELNENACKLESDLRFFERVSGINAKADVKEIYKDYFEKVSSYILTLREFYVLRNSPDYSLLTMEQLEDWNKKLYVPLYAENYEESYANPEYSVKKFGAAGKYMAGIFYDVLGNVSNVSWGRYYDLVNAAKLFIETYELFEAGKESAENLKKIISSHKKWCVKGARRIKAAESVDPSFDSARKVIMEADLKDLRYIYSIGKHVTQNEIRTAQFINSLSEEDVQSMADTFTNGFLVGYAKLGVDIRKKKSVGCYHVLGFERIIRHVIANMKKIGLEVCVSFIQTTEANRQANYDYKNLMEPYLDQEYVDICVAESEKAFEELKECANGYAGPLALEVFGQKDFQPVSKKESYIYSAEQNKLFVQLQNKISELTARYVLPEERSFAIISYPVPDIGEKFEEIFSATVKVNTLDYKTYENIQQKLIDALDQGDHVVIKGLGNNKTDLTIKNCELSDPSKQSAYENCVADVNIPVGEVFTSPVLKGTNGILNVGKVYLDGMLVKDLVIELRDGMILKCTCGNFEDEAEIKKYLDDLIMFHHDTLPIGEFAIGTNTTAYKMGIDFDVQDKLPVLIAEKTGPHFAMGDTCYSRSEDIKVFNPDGKEIIARDNEVSLLRKTQADKAYFNCHTDITIPYNELDTIDVIKKDGQKIRLIEKGRFVLPGTEELNKPLVELYGK